VRLRPRVLVIDDDRAILTLVGSVALAEGFDVATTVNGADTLQQLSTRPADLVLVDLRMPNVTGLEVLRAIREVNGRTRVVLMSGCATIDSAVMAVKLGAMDYLTKPFDLQRLRQLLSVRSVTASAPNVSSNTLRNEQCRMGDL
jgi:two-component system NtrC family response regulator